MLLSKISDFRFLRVSGNVLFLGPSKCLHGSAAVGSKALQ